MAAAGATAVVITSLGGHFCAKEFAAISPLPIINGPEPVSDYLKREGIQRVGVLGTRVVMRTLLNGTLSELDPVSPDEGDLNQIGDDYVAVAIAGTATAAQRSRLLNAGKKLVHDQGAEAVLLGGTDLSLVYNSAELDFRVIDSAIIHVEAIVNAAFSELK